MTQNYVTVFVFVTVLGLSRGRCSNYKIKFSSGIGKLFQTLKITSLHCVRTVNSRHIHSFGAKFKHCPVCIHRYFLSMVPFTVLDNP